MLDEHNVFFSKFSLKMIVKRRYIHRYHLDITVKMLALGCDTELIAEAEIKLDRVSC